MHSCSLKWQTLGRSGWGPKKNSHSWLFNCRINSFVALFPHFHMHIMHFYLDTHLPSPLVMQVSLSGWPKHWCFIVWKWWVISLQYTFTILKFGNIFSWWKFLDRIQATCNCDGCYTSFHYPFSLETRHAFSPPLPSPPSSSALRNHQLGTICWTWIDRVWFSHQCAGPRSLFL